MQTDICGLHQRICEVQLGFCALHPAGYALQEAGCTPQMDVFALQTAVAE